MADSGMFQGAASGAMTGASFGPWGALAGGVIGGISGLLGSRSARKKEDEARRQDQERRAAYGWGADQYNALGNRYGEDSKFVPQGVRTQFGRSFRDPATGEMVSEMDPRYTQMRDQWGNLFNQEYDRMQGFDPEKLAADRYGMMQRLLAGDRAVKTDNTMGMMLRRGLIGSAANDGTGGQTNPIMSGLQRSFADEDTKLALESMNWADQRRQQGLGLLSGMQGNIMGIDSRGDNLLEQSRGWSGMMNTHNLNALNGEYGFYGSGVDMGMKARLPADFVRMARNNTIDTNTAGATSFLGQLPGVFQGFRGMFGGGTGNMPLPEAPGEGGGSFVGRF